MGGGVNVVPAIRSGISRAGLAAAISLAALLVALIGASGASASKILGAPEFQNPGEPTYYTDATLVQVESVGDKYAAPADGVITSWGKWGHADPNHPSVLKLKIARLTSKEPPGWQIVGESNVETFEKLNAPNHFPTRIPVKAGDVIGVYGVGKQLLAWQENGYSAYGKLGADVLSSSGEFLQPVTGSQIVVDAVWEPDLDGDGYGDDSQDPCLNFPGNSGCAATVPGPQPQPQPQPKSKPKSCKKGLKKVKVKGKTQCRKASKGRHKGKGHKGKGKAKGHK
jgi:hypothetical protein